MAKREVLVSDMSGAEISEGTGATIVVKYHDAARGIRQLDVTSEEAEQIAQHGVSVARRGRKPKTEGASGTVEAQTSGKGSKTKGELAEELAGASA